DPFPLAGPDDPDLLPPEALEALAEAAKGRDNFDIFKAVGKGRKAPHGRVSKARTQEDVIDLIIRAVQPFQQMDEVLAHTSRRALKEKGIHADSHCVLLSFV